MVLVPWPLENNAKKEPGERSGSSCRLCLFSPTAQRGGWVQMVPVVSTMVPICLVAKVILPSLAAGLARRVYRRVVSL